MTHRRVISLRFWSRAALLAVATFWLAACAQQSPLPLADDSLRPAQPGNFDHVFLPPGERLPRITTLYIEPAQVALSDYWLRDRRADYTQRDLDRIYEDYGRFLDEALREGLSEQTGVTLTENREEADMIFRPTLRDLNIYAPDLSRPGITRHYTREAGNATFDLVLEDPNGKVLAQFIDHRETQNLTGQAMEWTNRVTNYRHFSRLMDRWTRNLSVYLLIAGAVPEPAE
ncbi:lipoprotein [Marinimicrobium sp. LS-A18]|uniref:LptM family lipoprotein n=1 Tax=Marinimicrobium sp. LS-A18 TaxID=1381596 RepID=UPI0004666420|nr:DUF3313 family protein [Marinimicrobium sp. LS-A18]